MIRGLAALLVALLLAAPLAAQPVAGLPPGVTAADRTAIQSVISHQLDAFKRDDAAGAYAFAAPNVQHIFPSPDIFLDMVRRGYPQVYRPRDAEFSELALQDQEIVQEVELVGPDGRPVLALYTMVRGADGNWLIAACALIPSARVGA